MMPQCHQLLIIAHQMLPIAENCHKRKFKNQMGFARLIFN